MAAAADALGILCAAGNALFAALIGTMNMADRYGHAPCAARSQCREPPEMSRIETVRARRDVRTGMGRLICPAKKAARTRKPQFTAPRQGKGDIAQRASPRLPAPYSSNHNCFSARPRPILQTAGVSAYRTARPAVRPQWTRLSAAAFQPQWKAQWGSTRQPVP